MVGVGGMTVVAGWLAAEARRHYGVRPAVGEGHEPRLGWVQSRGRAVVDGWEVRQQPTGMEKKEE